MFYQSHYIISQPSLRKSKSNIHENHCTAYCFCSFNTFCLHNSHWYKKIANEWCSCIGDLDDNTPKIASKQCDSLAEVQLELIIKDKWKEVQEKKLSIDTMIAFKLSIHMEYYKMTEKCRKQ